MQIEEIPNEVNQLESMFQYICNLYNMLDYLNGYLKSGDDYVAFAIRNAVIDSMLIKLRAFIDNKTDRKNTNFSLDCIAEQKDLTNVSDLKKDLEKIINISKTIAHLDTGVINRTISNSFNMKELEDFIIKIDSLLAAKSNRGWNFVTDKNHKKEITSQMDRYFKDSNK